MSKIQGLQLLSIGCVKNILENTSFDTFTKRYPQFHRKLMKKVSERPLYGDYLESALAYLEVNQRELALGEI